MVFLYDKKHKFVKVFGADKMIRQKMHKIFAKEVFDEEEIVEEQLKNEIYDIAHSFSQLIANGAINFEIGEGLVESIDPSLVKLRLKNGTSIEIDAGKSSGEPNSLCDALKKFIAIDDASENEILS